MQYHINPVAYSTVFAVPSDVVDKHIRLAGAAQLKVLLWMLRNGGSGCAVADIAAALGLAPMDVTDAMQYWVETGILLADAGAQAPAAASHTQALPQTAPPSAPKAEEQPERRHLPLAVTKPLSQDITKRAAESPELKYLFSHAQEKLGRTLGYDGQAKLLMMHDQYGLPVEVILMMIEYCVSREKHSLHYIEKMALDWADREIDTLEKAEERLAYLNRTNSLWSRLRALTGHGTAYPTAKQQKYLDTWSGQLGYDVDMIYLAYEETADRINKVSYAYMDTILKSWSENGLRTAAQVTQHELERKNSQKEKKRTGGTGTSYDLAQFEQEALYEPIVYQKKGE